MSPVASLRFTKMHGAGNDFVVIDLRGGQAAPAPEQVRALGDRHTGIGFDQLLGIQDSGRDDCVAGYRIWNIDGSTAEQCGNGARCVAAWLQRDGTATASHFRLDSPAGPIEVEHRGDDRYALGMGSPSFAPAALPFLVEAEAARYTLALERGQARFGAVSMGNPHAVIEVPSVEQAEVERLGPEMQSRAEFPEGVNVGFAQVLARDHVRLRVFERGAGETLACGSGACAAVAVLVRQGRVDRQVRVDLPGGTLEITWPSDADGITMAGPTAFVFEGETALSRP
jgi:diaminopimelate epimerase